ncbi:acyl-CoA thioester hydrolase [Salsuginibacillus halophilus]|uniref:Acyl-CoA thioester hydrolase n=1 Tax=Salsuginibacillus halophilus TaxID=517424 RepID=A0A2P8HBV2_9BACI|nr:acyl-CoA thioesterase [Salsuginibacillus halophilus]PSL43611.1 acyl-CoA thioester hydrolase [Salsuginibacillus halophilus]
MTYETQVKVRFSDTDALGHINNTSYFAYLEEARIDLLQHLGFTAPGAQTQRDFPFMVASASCDFKNQAYAGEILHVSTSLERIGNSSFTLQHHLTRDDGTEVAVGTAVLVYFDFQSGGTSPLTKEMKQTLQSLS